MCNLKEKPLLQRAEDNLFVRGMQVTESVSFQSLEGHSVVKDRKVIVSSTQDSRIKTILKSLGFNYQKETTTWVKVYENKQTFKQQATLTKIAIYKAVQE